MTATISTMRSTTREALGAPHQKMQYTFDQPEYTMADRAAANTRKHRRQHRKSSEDSDPTDGSGSLTYSAASSINSATESTDSSFADIMRVLDMQDPQQSKGMTPAEYHRYLQRAHLAPQPHKQRSQTSVASSLQYSTDGESHLLHGTDLVPSITGSMGQANDDMADDVGKYSGQSSDDFDSQDILFAPAEHTDSLKKRKKEKKNRSSRDSSSDPKSKPSYSRKGSSVPSIDTSHSKSSSSRRSPQNNKNNKTPPPVPRTRSTSTSVEDDICYAEWWMSCFPDAFKEMMPRR